MYYLQLLNINNTDRQNQREVNKMNSPLALSGSSGEASEGSVLTDGGEFSCEHDDILRLLGVLGGLGG
jgi:hypothetical protein